jgi:hypothetical protein
MIHEDEVFYTNQKEDNHFAEKKDHFQCDALVKLFSSCTRQGLGVNARGILLGGPLVYGWIPKRYFSYFSLKSNHKPSYEIPCTHLPFAYFLRNLCPDQIRGGAQLAKVIPGGSSRKQADFCSSREQPV